MPCTRILTGTYISKVYACVFLPVKSPMRTLYNRGDEPICYRGDFVSYRWVIGPHNFFCHTTKPVSSRLLVWPECESSRLLVSPECFAGCTNLFCWPHAARGPHVRHPCFISIFHLSWWKRLSICANEKKCSSRRTCLDRPHVCSFGNNVFHNWTTDLISPLILISYNCFLHLHFITTSLNNRRQRNGHDLRPKSQHLKYLMPLFLKALSIKRAFFWPFFSEYLFRFKPETQSIFNWLTIF